MAGLEVVVRPVVFPDIRPAPARSLPPQDDPEKGFAVIKGNGAKSLTLTDSFSLSMSKSAPVETQRREDEVRTYQMDDDGTVNKDNFIDTRVANKIWTKDGGADVPEGGFFIPGGAKGAKGNSFEIATYYQRQKEKDNIEIRNTDIIRKSGDE
jgi:hypothetical protein